MDRKMEKNRLSLKAILSKVRAWLVVGVCAGMMLGNAQVGRAEEVEQVENVLNVVQMENPTETFAVEKEPPIESLQEKMYIKYLEGILEENGISIEEE